MLKYRGLHVSVLIFKNEIQTATHYGAITSGGTRGQLLMNSQKSLGRLKA